MSEENKATSSGLTAAEQSQLDAAMGLEVARLDTPEEAPSNDRQEVASDNEDQPQGQAEPQEAGRQEEAPPQVSEKLPELLRFRQQAEKRAREAEERAASEVSQLKAQLEELQAKVKSPIDDPVEYFKSQGVNLLDVAKTLAAAELPADKADPNARLRYEQMKAKKEQMTELQKVRQELEEFKKTEEQRRTAEEDRRILAELRATDATVLQQQQDSDSLVGRLYKSQPDYVLGQMLEIRRRYVQQYPEDPPPTAEQAAELLESQLSPIASVFKPAQQEQASSNPQPKSDGAPKPVLSSETLAGRTGKDELPDDEEELVQYLANQIKSGAYLS